MGCRLPEPFGDTVIGSVTGDPITDCATQWQIETGSEAPELLPYNNGRGAIDVLPAAEAPPGGYTLLPPRSAQDARLINLNETLNDYVDGLRSQCFSSEGAATRARAALDDVGLTDWSVTVDASTPAADGTLHCWGAAGRARDRTAVVQAQTTDQPDADYMLLAGRLRTDRDQCWDLSTAAAHVRADASELGIPDSNVQITEVPRAAARCSVIHETVGGKIFIVLRGPSRGTPPTT